MNNRLSDIAVRLVPAESPSDNNRQTTGQATALLNELAEMLDALLTEQRTNLIDLRSLPLSADDFRQLRDTLGEGEVRAEFDAQGETRIVETGVPGIWWHTYFNAEGGTLTELLEVTYFPEILKSQREDMAQGLQALRETLSATGTLREALSATDRKTMPGVKDTAKSEIDP